MRDLPLNEKFLEQAFPNGIDTGARTQKIDIGKAVKQMASRSGSRRSRSTASGSRASSTRSRTTHCWSASRSGLRPGCLPTARAARRKR
ncbi:hypothetical protein [Kibdelosporangium philippinense]|uniref:hypothetical protein n=1 Tax=Kibdelosporangium philippinense TaxID=211113 RepID=UPI0036113575